MRCSVPLAAMVLLASCGGQETSERGDSSPSPGSASYDVAEQATTDQAPSSGPGIAPTAAPGVAFNYRYAFRLPAQQISNVQEQHAQACEKLGINRCRITGMRYRLVNEADIEGMLAFKLDPAIAREFGKAGVAAVARAEGMMVDSEISGVDAGAAIQASTRAVAQLNDDLARIEAQLTKRGLSAEERSGLLYQAQRLRDSIRANRDRREESQESLATTPMVFEYGSGDLIPGFDTRSPIRNSIEQAGNNFIGAIAWMFVIVATLLPWLLLALAGWWLLQRSSLWLRRRDNDRRAEPASQPEPIGGE
ncbi:hypothetical protein [Sphingomonas sp.]|uniref:hypothetical protein n=1 Tax=Sphingomonas sp. TaxID=28214 RepID=UPI002FCBDE44